MHVSGSEENFKYQIHCTCSKVIVKNIGNLIVRLLVFFAVNIPLFFHNCIPFRSRSRPVFLRLRLRLRLRANRFGGSDSGSGSDHNVSAPAAPAPAPAPAPHPWLWVLDCRGAAVKGAKAPIVSKKIV